VRRRRSASARRPTGSRRAGFTLAELLVVITIITIGATLVLPVVVGLARTQRVGSSARAVQAMLHGARSMAAAQRRYHAVTFFKSTEIGSEAATVLFGCLITDESCTAAARQQAEMLPQGLNVQLFAGGDPTPRSVPDVVGFGPDGTVDLGVTTPYRIVLINRDDEHDTVDIIVRRTGAIEVIEVSD